jgi:hypothetical protein
MKQPVLRRCPDGHYRRVIFDLAAYIADYPEQVYLAGIVQNWCTKYVITMSLNGGVLILHLLDVWQTTIISMSQRCVDLMNSPGD